MEFKSEKERELYYFSMHRDAFIEEMKDYLIQSFLEVDNTDIDTVLRKLEEFGISRERFYDAVEEVATDRYIKAYMRILDVTDFSFKIDAPLLYSMEKICWRYKMSLEDAFIAFAKNVVKENKLPFNSKM